MRILFLSPWFPYPLDAGFRIRVYHLLLAMARYHSVTVLSLDPKGWAPAQVDAIAALCEHAAVVHRDPFQRGRIRTLTRFLSVQPVTATPFREMTQQVLRLHSDQPFDVVIAGSVFMASYALAVHGIPRVLEEHNSLTRWMQERYEAQTSPFQRWRCWASWRKTILYESQLFRRFDLVTMVSKQDAEVSRHLLRNRGTPVEVIPNGVDFEQYAPFEPEPNTLVFNGPLIYGANYEAIHFFLNEVYPLIRSQCPEVRLRITGSLQGVDTSSLRLDPSVTLTGFIEDIRTVVASSWVLIAPILSGSGTRHKILQAMAARTPVVSTPKGAEGLEVTDGVDILLADDPVEFAGQVVRLLRDSALHRQLATHGRQLVERSYDWSEIGRRFVDLVESVAERRGRA